MYDYIFADAIVVDFSDDIITCAFEGCRPGKWHSNFKMKTTRFCT